MPRVNKDAKKIEAFILKNISSHSGDVVAVASEKFSVSRTTIHRFLNKLVKRGDVVKTGTTNRINYSLKDDKNRSLEFKIASGVGEDKIWSKYLKVDLLTLSPNIYEICEYGFTEMYNNVLDHSEGYRANVRTEWGEGNIEICISDDGIGAFRKIKDKIHLEDERESIFQLSKGKLTTDPQRHTGEGVFFTSKAFDKFTLEANGLIYTVANTEEGSDWFMEKSSIAPKKKGAGTKVCMKISLKSPRILRNIFSGYYTDPETLKFDKTQVVVRLSKFEEERFISRSQAKRVVFGLEKFQQVILDFNGVIAVGQGFVDEVFRVFSSSHPEVEIKYINASDEVEFMIKRGQQIEGR